MSTTTIPSSEYRRHIIEECASYLESIGHTRAPQALMTILTKHGPHEWRFPTLANLPTLRGPMLGSEG